MPVLTDIERLEIDSYVLTSMIKKDGRFDVVPLVMHSLLKTESNQA